MVWIVFNVMNLSVGLKYNPMLLSLRWGCILPLRDVMDALHYCLFVGRTVFSDPSRQGEKGEVELAE